MLRHNKLRETKIGCLQKNTPFLQCETEKQFAKVLKTVKKLNIELMPCFHESYILFFKNLIRKEMPI